VLCFPGGFRRLANYNLDVVTAAGYRVNCHEATQFRIWATNARDGVG